MLTVARAEHDRPPGIRRAGTGHPGTCDRMSGSPPPPARGRGRGYAAERGGWLALRVSDESPSRTPGV